MQVGALKMFLRKLFGKIRCGKIAWNQGLKPCLSHTFSLFFLNLLAFATFLLNILDKYLHFEDFINKIVKNVHIISHIIV